MPWHLAMQLHAHRLMPAHATARAERGESVQQRMPVARDVAGPVHHPVPETRPVPREAAAALACPVTAQDCPALAALFGGLRPEGEAARSWLLSLAPCTDCRIACEGRRAALRHLRLGQREREILAGAAQTDVLVLTERGMSRSASAARRRAALSLGKAGLVAPATLSRGSDGGGPLRAAVALTDLGRYVMAAYGRFITAGKPVRWTRPLKGVAVPGRAPAELVEETLDRSQAALQDTLAELKGVLVAAVAGRIKDPSRLDAVTRHLEEKATLLRAALAPSRTPVHAETGAGPAA